VQKCQQGIIYIDEIDKICRKDENPSITRERIGRGRPGKALAQDPGRHSGQRAAPGRDASTPIREFTPVDTTNILFICGGAFRGFWEKVIARRTGKKAMGFLQEDEKVGRSVSGRRD